MTDYTPIDCDLHSEFELAILHQDRLKPRWCAADGGIRIETVLPTDLGTRNSEEFMVASDADGTAVEIRLDRILRFAADLKHRPLAHVFDPVFDNN